MPINVSPAGTGGAVVANDVSSAVLLAIDTFRNNSAGIRGGAVEVRNSTDVNVTLLSSTFTSNKVRA